MIGRADRRCVILRVAALTATLMGTADRELASASTQAAPKAALT